MCSVFPVSLDHDSGGPNSSRFRTTPQFTQVQKYVWPEPDFSLLSGWVLSQAPQHEQGTGPSAIAHCGRSDHLVELLAATIIFLSSGSRGVPFFAALIRHLPLIPGGV